MAKQTEKVEEKRLMKQQKVESDFMEAFEKSVKRREKREKQRNDYKNEQLIMQEDKQERKLTKAWERKQK